MANSLIGRTLGNYEVIDHLGQGGMATVYIGYQESVDRKVAVKVLPPHPGLDDQFIERFKVEARTIARLQHPHILPLYDYGSTDDNILYLVMAFIEGGSLEERIVDGPMPMETIERFLRQIAGAMDYAHRQDIVHRDIKPGNILIDGENNALLADFGIAKISDSNLTGTGVVGTPAYMAPEQAQGIGVDHRIDIYSLGVVVYQMLTGTQPYTAATPMQLLVKVIQEPVPNILLAREDLPAALSQVMRRVLAKDPDERYQTATAFAEAFSRAIHSHDESYANIQRTMPVDSPDMTPTALMPSSKVEESATVNLPGTQVPSAINQTDPQNQTIIVQGNSNTLLILGGFAVIAIALVIVVLIVVGQNGDDNNDPDNNQVDTALQTQQANATQQALDDEEVDNAATEVAALPVVEEAETFGRLTFGSANGLGDSVSLQLSELRPLADGLVYEAWLVNTATDEKLSIGRTVVDAVGSGSLSYVDADGRMLAAEFNAIALSVEDRSVESTGEPSDDVPYSGRVPLEITTFLNETLIESEDGINGGSLLDGARTEAGTAASHAGLAARASNVGGLHSHAEHTINILRGEEEDYNSNERGENPGRGIGVYFFLDQIEGLLDSALNAPDADVSLQVDGELVRVCLFNTRERADQVIEIEFELLAETEDIANVEDIAGESQVLAERLTSGVDLNENGIIQAFEEECGLDQVETFGILVASMDVFEGGLDDNTDE